MKKLILAVFAVLALCASVYAATGDRTPAGKIKHGAPASATAACVQGEQRVTAKHIFTCMTTNVWKNYSSVSF